MNPEHLKDCRQMKLPTDSRLSGASFEWAYSPGGGCTPPFLVKKIKKDKKKLIQQYQWLQKFKKVQGIPITRNPEESWQTFSYKIEYIFRGDPLFKVAKNLTHDRLRIIAKNLLGILVPSIYVVPSSGASSDTVNYYKLKLLNKLDQCGAMPHNHHRLLESSEIIVNGHTLRNFPSIKEDLWHFVCKSADKMRYRQCWIHGDLTAENILVTKEDEVFLIDPNPDTTLSHPVLDIAKLWQSFHSGFEINRGIKVEKNDIELLFKENYCKNYDLARRVLTREFQKYYEIGEQEILLHEIIHFARLLPYALNSSEDLFLWSYSKFIELSNDLLNMSGEVKSMAS